MWAPARSRARIELRGAGCRPPSPDVPRIPPWDGAESASGLFDPSGGSGGRRSMVGSFARGAGESGSGDCGALFHDASVEQVDGSLRVPRVARVVRDHAERGAVAMEIAQQLHHRLAAL